VRVLKVATPRAQLGFDTGQRTRKSRSVLSVFCNEDEDARALLLYGLLLRICARTTIPLFISQISIPVPLARSLFTLSITPSSYFPLFFRRGRRRRHHRADPALFSHFLHFFVPFTSRITSDTPHIRRSRAVIRTTPFGGHRMKK
jgi:hypothetical protein